ncbi:signal recognition particle 9 kDa protein-domain-containing protein [Apiospora rasikravindrae]|uniref:Signal recognition particle 9 kDa protein-domain-containing protein n=1 Tax=Apiospora rasikravindrae TaxID=990691 RepID=A0ABR1RWE2_9PEZI
MPHYAKSEEWLRESQLLLEARPTTTRITTKYAIKVPKVRKPKPDADNDTPTEPAAAKPARGSLTLKTYDPISGVTLKYRTSKAAEVSRLILCLGKLSRPMAGLPELKDEIMADAPAEGEGTPAAEKSEAAATTTAAPAVQQQQTPAAGGGGGKGKKKKGKK